MTTCNAATPATKYVTKSLAFALGKASDAAKSAKSVAFGKATDVMLVAFGEAGDDMLVALGKVEDMNVAVALGGKNSVVAVALWKTTDDVTEPLNTIGMVVKLEEGKDVAVWNVVKLL